MYFSPSVFIAGSGEEDVSSFNYYVLFLIVYEFQFSDPTLKLLNAFILTQNPPPFDNDNITGEYESKPIELPPISVPPLKFRGLSPPSTDRTGTDVAELPRDTPRFFPTPEPTVRSAVGTPFHVYSLPSHLKYSELFFWRGRI